MDDRSMTKPKRQWGVGEMGLALILTSLLLVPMMIFAAFGVDLASWYARANTLQTAADAAALAGSPYMPDLARADTVVDAILKQNGLEDGIDSLLVTAVQGADENSLIVTLTDTDVDRYFSQVFRGKQTIVRTSEAVFHLPIPMGSPLHYFGGDQTKTAQPDIPQPDTYSVQTPTTYATVAPSTRPCNIGTSSSQNLGTWPASGSFDATGWTSGASQCKWNVVPVGSPTTGSGAGSNSFPPSDYTTRPPLSSPCAVKTDGGNTTQDQWKVIATVPTYSSSTSGAPTTKCSWTKWTTILSSLPSVYATQAPTNAKCRTGYEPNDTHLRGSGVTAGSGWFKGSGSSDYQLLKDGGGNADKAVAGKASDGNRLCNWLVTATIITTNPVAATIVTTQHPPIPGTNPIASTRSPGFWALVEGPGTVAPNGDAYSVRCYITANCTSGDNLMYRPSSDQNRGYWYSIKIPTGLSGAIVVSVFDGSNNPSGSLSTLAGDASSNVSNAAVNGAFETEYTMYKQNNALDFSVRSRVGSSPGDTTEGSCHWKLGSESGFRGQWNTLCTLNGVSSGETYLLNVRTNGTTGSGLNGYAVQACAQGNCDTALQPALAAISEMAIFNNVTEGESTFYLAEVGQQYNGRVLVVNLYDAGDVNGDADLYVMKPATSAPKPTVHVPAATCKYTASPYPNSAQNNSDGGGTGTQVVAPQASDDNSKCMVRTDDRKFNGEWLQIRITIPTTYTCTMGVDPETTANSCWWGIKYDFENDATDATTWTARIEGNPLRLTK